MSPAPLKSLVCAFLAAALLLAGCAPTPTPQASPQPKSTQVEEISTAAPTDLPSPVAPVKEATPTGEPQAQPAGDPVEIRLLKMFTPQQGWAVDTTGHILRTQVGPFSWEDVTPSEAWPESDYTRAVAAFLDADQAWAVFYIDQTPALAAGTDVWHTSDGGQSWEKLGAIPATEEMNSGVQMQFVDDQHGWFLGQIYPGMSHVYAMLFATSDGGDTWTLISDSTPAGENEEGETLQGSYSLPFGDRLFEFIAPQTGFASTKDMIRSTDGGKTWAIQSLPDEPSAGDLEQPYTFSTPPQFSTPNDGAFLYSVYDFNLVACPPCDLFDGVPVTQVMYTTRNGGNNWVKKASPGVLGVIDFLDAEMGWYLGIQEADQETTSLYATQDGGEIWTQIAATTPLPLGSRIEFFSDQVGFATNPYVGRGYENMSLKNLAGTDAYLYQTLDGGATWQLIEPMVTR